MKKILALLIATVAAGPAMAADEIYIAPTGSSFDWSGAYGGVNVGWAWGSVDSSTSVPATSNINATATGLALLLGDHDFDPDGFIGGVQAGMNWQRGALVYGIEGDINFLDMTETDIKTGTFGVSSGRVIDEIDMNLLATLRGRVGFAADKLLVFGTGGIAFSDADFNRALEWSFADGCPTGSTGFNRCHVGGGSFDIGYTIGGGVEYAFANRYSIKGEYLYTDFGDVDFTTVNSSISDQPLNHSASFDFHTLRIGLNIHF